MLKITEWHERYEVGFKGGEPKKGDTLRVGPLRFIRLKVHGHEQGAGYRRLLRAAKDKSMQVFGIFCKFLEISGNQPRETRGGLFNEKGNPASLEDLAFILSVPVSQIAYAVKILCSDDVGWLESTEPNSTQPNSTQLNTTQGPGNSPKFPEISGKRPPEKTLYGEFVKLTKEEYEKLHERYGARLQEKIDALNEGIGSKGYKYKSHYFTILAWERRNERISRNGQGGNHRPNFGNQKSNIGTTIKV